MERPRHEDISRWTRAQRLARRQAPAPLHQDPRPPAAEGGSQADAALSLPSRDELGGNQAHTHLPAAPGRDLPSAREDPVSSEPQERAPREHEPRRDGLSKGRRALISLGRRGAAHKLVDEPLEQTLQSSMVGRQAPGERGNSGQERDGGYSAAATGGGGGPALNVSRAGTTRTEGAELSTVAIARSLAHPSTERMPEVRQEAGDDPLVPSVQPGVRPSTDSTPRRVGGQAQGQHPADQEGEGKGGTSSVHGGAEGHEGEDEGRKESEKRRSEEKREGHAARAGPATRSRTTLTRGEVQGTVDDPDVMGTGGQAPPARRESEGPRSKVREIMDRRGRGVQGRALELGRSGGRTGHGRLTTRSLIEPRHAILAQLDGLSEEELDTACRAAGWTGEVQEASGSESWGVSQEPTHHGPQAPPDSESRGQGRATPMRSARGIPPTLTPPPSLTRRDRLGVQKPVRRSEGCIVRSRGEECSVRSRGSRQRERDSWSRGKREDWRRQEGW
ncbi:hypothetical protein B484DRAFT_472756 [Ochromonadaceae sp. CCMP2298]|nr:hypothetical protein B484DRAFT_472756 [Ochromonadaceae sp. CCMP2298]